MRVNVNVFCGEAYNLHRFIQIIGIGQDQWSIDAIVPTSHSPPSTSLSLPISLARPIQISIRKMHETTAIRNLHNTNT